MQRKVFDRKVFNRKLVVITGGCAGIGRALAVRMAQAGARLVIFDLHQDALDGLVQHLADHHNADALGLCCDVSYRIPRSPCRYSAGSREYPGGFSPCRSETVHEAL